MVSTGLAGGWFGAVCFCGTGSLKRRLKPPEDREEVRYLAFHDDLTGVRNRQYFKDMLQDLDAEGERERAFCTDYSSGLMHSG